MNFKNEILGQMLELFAKPDQFFKKKSQQDTSLKTPALIVCWTAIIVTLFDLFIALSISDDYENVILLIFMVMYALYFFMIILFSVWFVHSALFYLLSVIFRKKQGYFTRLLEFTGYGMIIYLPISIIVFMIGWICIVVNGNVVVRPIPDELMCSPFMTVMEVLMTFIIIMFLVGANIWRFGLKHALNMPLGYANFVVGIHFAINIIGTLVFFASI